jgi:hypothetical protein
MRRLLDELLSSAWVNSAPRDRADPNKWASAEKRRGGLISAAAKTFSYQSSKKKDISEDLEMALMWKKSSLFACWQQISE